jgi:hypothetical protein
VFTRAATTSLWPALGGDIKAFYAKYSKTAKDAKIKIDFLRALGALRVLGG